MCFRSLSCIKREREKEGTGLGAHKAPSGGRGGSLVRGTPAVSKNHSDTKQLSYCWCSISVSIFLLLWIISISEMLIRADFSKTELCGVFTFVVCFVLFIN